MKSGLKLVSIAIIGYLFAYLGHYQAILLLLGFVILVEKEEWLKVQLFQALVLRLAYDVTSSILDLIITEFNELIGLEYKLLNIYNHYIEKPIYYLFLVLIIIAITKVLKKQQVEIPIITTWVNKAIIKSKSE